MFSELEIDDIDQVYKWSPVGWEFELIQLSPGMLRFKQQIIELPGIQFEWNCYGQRLLQLECASVADVVLAIVVESNQMPLFMGKPVEPNVGLVYQFGREIETVVYPGTRTLAVTVSEECVRALGAQVSTELLRRIPSTDVRRLVRELGEVTRMASSFGATEDEGISFALRDRALRAFARAFAPWTCHDALSSVDVRPGRAFEIVEAATVGMSRMRIDEKPSIAVLAQLVGVSERTLYNSFRRCLGVGPYEWHLIRRLHSFRRELLTEAPFHGKISQAAISLGFDHFGRLSDNYRRHFGETPRQTIKRRTNR